MTEETGWLLEKMHNGNVHYICADYVLQWTEDPNKALRLSRREDAEALCTIVEDCEKIAQHEWCASHSESAPVSSPVSPSLKVEEVAAGEQNERGYWPTLLDRGDGVRDHYCIGRLIKPGEPYWEFWNKGQWTSAGELFIGREAAQAQLGAIRAGDAEDPLDNEAVDNELRRWQDAIRDKLIDLGAPDWKIDGAGCDSGDPLDFTLAEIGQGVGYFINQLEELKKATQ